MKAYGSIWLAVALLAAPLGAFADEDNRGRRRGFSFALWGDLPYGPNEYDAVINRTVPEINADDDVAFTIFIGDTKGGSTPCDDATIITGARSFLDATRKPTLYVPGDNEWTDCHRTAAGGYDPLERLALIRREFFSTPWSLGRRRMKVDRQSFAFPENQRWVKNGIVFLTLHMVGSNNNKVNQLASPTPTNPWPECLAANSVRTENQCHAANAEYVARNAANLTWLAEGFELARRIGARGVVVAAQASPGFDIPQTAVNERLSPSTNGFDDFLNAIVAEARQFHGQVLYVYGDDHIFQVSMPFSDPVSAPYATNLVTNVVAVQTFGANHPWWVEINVDPDSRSVFSVEPRVAR